MPDPTLAELVLLGEAAGEGEEGLRAVADIIYNRSKARKLTLDQVVSQPKQFSAYDRPDLKAFYAKQPEALRLLAQQILSEVQAPDYQPLYPGVQNYVTTDLYDRRYAHGSPSWLQKMEPVATVGHHVFLREPKRVTKRAH